MKKHLLLTTLLLPFSLVMMAQGNYPVVAEKFHRYYNKQQADSLFMLYSANIKNALPLEKTKEVLSQLHSQFGELNTLTPTGEEAAYHTWKATFTKGTLTLILALNQDNLLDGFRLVPYEEKKVTITAPDNYILQTGKVTINGTLTLPAGNDKVPVVLLIAGSGPTDRNGNNTMGLNTNAYKMLADSLQVHGIACLRYDKRGVGNSAAGINEATLTFDTFVDDAAGFIKMLQADKRFSQVVVAGHSEGSLIGMLAAAKTKASRFISIAGAGEKISIILKKQMQTLAPERINVIAPLLDSLQKGMRVHNSDPSLESLFRSSVQPFMISWMKYDPQQEIKKLKIPVLIIQGNTDMQVSMHDAKLLKQAAPGAVFEEIDQMNHVLKTASSNASENAATYTNPALPLKAELVRKVVGFIR